VICVDLRNHGSSPHHESMKFPEMSSDVIELMNQLEIERAVILGHSLGGKVAMSAALEHPERVKGIIAADIAPVNYSALKRAEWTQVRHIVQTVAETNPEQFDGRSQVEKYLEDKIPSLAMRQFVVANFVKDEESNRWKWRIHVDSILKHLEYFSTWPYESRYFPNPAFFISGEKSNYLSESDRPEILQFFPDSKFHIVPGAGHWLHADNPKDFIASVGSFLHSIE
jgi:esterase